MELPPLIKQFDKKLQGLPDKLLTSILLVSAAVIIIIALFSRPVLKAAVAAWVLAP